MLVWHTVLHKVNKLQIVPSESQVFVCVIELIQDFSIGVADRDIADLKGIFQWREYSIELRVYGWQLQIIRH